MSDITPVPYRSGHIRSLSILSVVLLLLVLVGGNVLLARTSVRADLTEDKLYTLNEGSRSILEKLEDPATIKIFWDNVPSTWEPTKRYVDALLEEMQQVADEKLQVIWVDMEEEEGVEEASELGVKEFQFGAVEGDEYRAANGFMSLVLSLGEEKPAIFDALHQIQDQLELQLISEIHRRSRLSAPIVGFVQPPAPPFGAQQVGAYSNLERVMSQSLGDAFRPRVSLDEPVEADIEALLVIAPENLSDEAVYHFEQFLLRGGRAMVLLEPVDFVGLRQRGGVRADSGLEDWLDHLGVSVDRGVAGDFETNGAWFVSRELRRYPYWPIASSEHVEKDHPLTRNLSPFVMRWPAGFQVDGPKQEEAGREVTVLASTSPAGYRRPDLIGVNDTVESAGGKSLEQVPLFVMVDGPVQSFWNDKERLPTEADPDAEADGEPPEESGVGLAPVDLPREGDDEAMGSPDGDASGSPDGDASGSPDGDASGSPDGEPAGSADGADNDAPPPAAPEPAPAEPEPAAPDDDVDGDGAAPDEEDAPAPAAGDDMPGEAAPAEPEIDPRADHLKEGKVRLLIAGDAELVADFWLPGRDQTIGFLAQMNGFRSGFNLVIGATEWMSGSDELMSLRTRNDNPRTLEKIEKSDQKLVQWLNILLVPLLMLLIGLVVFIVRRS